MHPGCPPGAWRRDSWHFQLASLNLQSIVDLGPLHTMCCTFPSRVRLTPLVVFSLPERAAANAARGAKHLVLLLLITPMKCFRLS